MRVDLEAELANISTLLEQAEKKAGYWTDEVKRLTGAKEFGQHLMEIASRSELAPSPQPGAGFDDDDGPLLAPALVGAGANGARP